MIPQDVAEVLARLSRSGYEAWCVGGCVRDALLGAEPQDWDVTTSALPEQVERIFPGRTIPTGVKHGTVTVRSGGRSIEVTTFRRDGAYLDGRHPEHVTFTASLREDLARRDFTVNAMAMNADGTIVDCWGGREDLRRGIIRCVGEAERRFEEDALRIMRALRFAAVLGFTIERETSYALRRDRERLRAIAAERIYTEFTKLICGKHMAPILREYPDVLAVFLPEIGPMVGFDQRNPHHCYDLWEHTIRAMEAVPPEAVLRYTMLLHDIGKVKSFTVDEKGIGHFYGHPRLSREMAEAIARRLKMDNERRELILTLVEWHDRVIPRTEKGVARALRKLGEERFRLLLQVKRADNMAQASQAFQTEIDRTEELCARLVGQGRCLSLRQLAVNGRDLMELGYRGTEIGRELEHLLDLVVDGVRANDRRELLDIARRGKSGQKDGSF
ncbi:HD domain-containing protein [Oscillibacter sp. MSJ-2]|uniref:HD domain-containing protein n=1 Tax=Dysosmobacter acutus TaxID=2841504 RepID=A0ABS6F9E0_9FIRM|nr:HD domain-containing protein [Dysosmobacter acutus]